MGRPPKDAVARPLFLFRCGRDDWLGRGGLTLVAAAKPQLKNRRSRSWSKTKREEVIGVLRRDLQRQRGVGHARCRWPSLTGAGRSTPHSRRLARGDRKRLSAARAGAARPRVETAPRKSSSARTRGIRARMLRPIGFDAAEYTAKLCGERGGDMSRSRSRTRERVLRKLVRLKQGHEGQRQRMNSDRARELLERLRDAEPEEPAPDRASR